MSACRYRVARSCLPAHVTGNAFNPEKSKKENQMAKAYYSTVLDHSADQVWSVIRPFDH
jgi:hypothetical protein